VVSRDELIVDMLQRLDGKVDGIRDDLSGIHQTLGEHTAQIGVLRSVIRYGIPVILGGGGLAGILHAFR